MVEFMASLVELSHKYIAFRKRAAPKGGELRVFTQPLRVVSVQEERSEYPVFLVRKRLQLLKPIARLFLAQMVRVKITRVTDCLRSTKKTRLRAASAATPSPANC